MKSVRIPLGAALLLALTLPTTAQVTIVPIKPKPIGGGFQVRPITPITIGGAGQAGGNVAFVTIGDPRNVPKYLGGDITRPVGGVARSFRLGKFEVTNAQYAAFLNSNVAVVDEYQLYDTRMATDPYGGIERVVGPPDRFVVRQNMENKPVNFVSWFCAARFCNWMHNGRRPEQTEIGAYKLADAWQRGTVAPREAGARFFIPIRDEWYKAAYYKGRGTGNTYWLYPTRSDDVPEPVVAGATGTASSPSKFRGNTANYNGRAKWKGSVGGNVTTVGRNGGPSSYGTYDQGGNVWEWAERQDPESSINDPFRSWLLGGNFETGPRELSGDLTVTWSAGPTYRGPETGFRIGAR